MPGRPCGCRRMSGRGATQLPETRKISRSDVAAACREAEKIVDSAKAEARETIRSAAARGRADGLQKGMAAASAECSRRNRQAVERLREKSRAEEKRLAGEYRERERREQAGVTELGFSCAARIADMELHRDDSLFLGLVRTAAAHMGKPAHLVLRAGPLGMTAARHYRMELEKIFGGPDKYEVSPGGHNDGICVIDTPEGSVDSGVETQLRRAAQLVGLPAPKPEMLPGTLPADERE